MITALQVVFLIISVGIIVSVLFQSGKGGGLSGSLGGGGESSYARKKGFEAVLEKMTIYLGVSFVIVSIVLTLIGG